MTHHRTYRVSVGLVQVVIGFAGEEPVKLPTPEGGHDRGLDMALDYLLKHGWEPLCYGPAPRLDFSSSSIAKTEHYIVTTVPVTSTIKDDIPT